MTEHTREKSDFSEGAEGKQGRETHKLHSRKYTTLKRKRVIILIGELESTIRLIPRKKVIIDQSGLGR